MKSENQSRSVMWGVVGTVVVGSIVAAVSLFLEYKTGWFQDRPINTPASPASSPPSGAAEPAGAAEELDNKHDPVPTEEVSAELFIGERLPQTWEGTLNQKGYDPYPMILHVELSRGSYVKGQLNWPTFGNGVTAVEGEFIENIDDFVEQSKWRILKEGDAKDAKRLRLTELQLIAGGTEEIELNGQYYCYINSDGVLRGVFFRQGDTSPEGSFTLARRAPNQIGRADS